MRIITQTFDICAREGNDSYTEMNLLFPSQNLAVFHDRGPQGDDLRIYKLRTHNSSSWHKGGNEPEDVAMIQTQPEKELVFFPEP